MSDENDTPSEGFDDGFLGADIQVEDRAFGPQYPIAQWVNGNPKNKRQGGIAYTGGVFIATEQGISGEKLQACGFEPYSLVTNDGTEVPGFAASRLVISPIRYRRCWQVVAEGQLPQRFGWDEYDAATEAGKPRGVAHLLVAIHGLEEPVLLSFRGMTARRVMGQGKERGIVPSYSQKICGTAKKIARENKKDKNYPLCLFRLTLSPEVEGKAPKFTEVGKGSEKNLVTHPCWQDEPAGEVDMALLKRLYVGDESAATYQDWHKGADEWVGAWDTETLQDFRGRRAKRKAEGGTEGEEAADGTPGERQVTF